MEIRVDEEGNTISECPICQFKKAEVNEQKGENRISDIIFKCPNCLIFQLHENLVYFFNDSTLNNTLKEYSSDHIELDKAAIKDYRGKISKTIRKLSENDSPVEIVSTEGMANGINFITYQKLIKSVL